MKEQLQEESLSDLLERVGVCCEDCDLLDAYYTVEMLLALGVGQQYRGFSMAVKAICIAADRADALTQVRLQILEPIGQRFGCCWKSVDRNLRTVIQCAWRMNAAHLQKLAVYPLYSEPSVSEFISLMSSHVIRRRMRQALRAQDGCERQL